MSNRTPLDITVFKGTTVLGDSTFKDLLITNTLSTFYYPSTRKWKAILVNSNGNLNYDCISDPPTIPTGDNVKKELGRLLAIILPIVAFVLLLLYIAYLNLFPTLLSCLPPSSDTSTSSGNDNNGNNRQDRGRNDREQNNTEDENVRRPINPNTPGSGEIARIGNEVLRDNSIRSRLSGRIGSQQEFRNFNPLYETFLSYNVS